MPRQPRLSVLVLYCHALLGEGIARMLVAEPGVDVALTAGSQPEAVEIALNGHPDMVVVERCASLDARRIMDRVPDALVIDVGIGPGPTWVYRRQEIPGRPEAILQLVRLLRGGHPVLALEERPARPVQVHRAGV